MVLKVTRSSLTMVIGAVGSGKSTLLAALLGQVSQEAGSVEAYGSIAFCSQEPFIMHATVRDNILFHKEYNESRCVEIVVVTRIE